MNQFNRYSTRFAGVMLIIGPLLLMCAAVLAAAGRVVDRAQAIIQARQAGIGE